MKKTSSLLAFILFVVAGHSQRFQSKEDWNKLAINRGDFSSENAIEAGVQTQQGFTRELLQVQWRRGDPIDVYVIRPENAVRPPIVLFLYSWPNDNELFKSDAWCRTVTSHGMAAVGFASALTSHRYHDRPWKQTFVTELPEALGKTVHDVQLMLDLLGERKDLDTSRMGIFGQGSGGTVALLAASVDPRLRAIDVIDPWGDWPDWVRSSPMVSEEQRPDLAASHFQDAVAPFDPATIMKQLSGRALRLQQTDINPSTPEHSARRLQAALPASAEYVRYTGEADYRERAMKDGRILNWIASELAAPSQGESLQNARK